MFSWLPASARLSLGVSAMYGCSSFSLSLLNKSILSGYEFRGYFLIMSSQMIVSLLFCYISRRWYGNPYRIPDVNGALLWRLVRANLRGARLGPQTTALGVTEW